MFLIKVYTVSPLPFLQASDMKPVACVTITNALGHFLLLAKDLVFGKEDAAGSTNPENSSER